MVKQFIQKYRKALAFAVTGVWLVGVLYGFWSAELQYLGKFSDRLVEFNGRENLALTLAPTQGSALVVHFIDSSCPCTDYTQKHISDLQKKYAPTTEFVAWNSSQLSEEQRSVLSKFKVPASPAVAIWNKAGKLTYFGPYSSGAFCGQGTDFVSISINNIQNGNAQIWVNNDVAGCFCDWPFNQPDIRL